MRPVRIGLIGAGGAARAIHVPGFRQAPGAELVAVCDPDPKAAAETGIAAAVTRPDEILSRDDVDAVVVATPNYLHREIVLAAIAAGKHVLSEKPLAMNLAEARQMLDAAERARLVHMTAFTYQFTPAIRYMRHLAAAGRLGRVRTVRAAYLMALSGHLLGWRSLKRHAGSGVLADIGSHLIHLAQYVAGPVAVLSAHSRRFREDPSSDVEDWIAFLAEYDSGACGTFEISRVSAGRGAAITEEMFIELYGDAGSAAFSVQKPWSLDVALDDDARDPARPLRQIPVPPEFLKLDGSPRDPHAQDPRWGYRYDQAFQFVESVRLRQARQPTFADGVRCQAVLDAALKSAESRLWVEVER